MYFSYTVELLLCYGTKCFSCNVNRDNIAPSVFFLPWGRNWHCAFYGRYTSTTESYAEPNELQVIQRIELITNIYCTDFDCPEMLIMLRLLKHCL